MNSTDSMVKYAIPYTRVIQSTTCGIHYSYQCGVQLSIISKMVILCRYIGTCLNLPVDLKQWQFTLNCTNTMYHMYQSTYTCNNGITSSELRIIFKDWIGQFHQALGSNSESDFFTGM